MRADELSSRAREIHFASLVFDTHADTPQRFFFDQFDLGPRDAEGCVDIPRLREGGVGAIFFALWVPVEITGARGDAARAGFACCHTETNRNSWRRFGALRLFPRCPGGASGEQNRRDVGDRRRACHRQRPRGFARISRARRALHDADAQRGDRMGGLLERRPATQRADGFRQTSDPGNESARNARRCFPRFRSDFLRRPGDLPRAGRSHLIPAAARCAMRREISMTP